MTKQQFLKASRRTRFNYLFMRHPLTILFGYVFIFQYGMCLYPPVTNLRENYDGLLALLLHLALAVLITWFFGWVSLLLTLIVPHFIASAIGSYLFYAQHNFPTVSFRDNSCWTYDHAAMESSSFLRTGPIMSWFTANIWVPPCASLERPDSLLPPARSGGWNSRAAITKNDLASSSRNPALFTVESLGSGH